MSAGPSPVVARLQGRIWVQQLQRQYRPGPRNMARMADESQQQVSSLDRNAQEPQVRTYKTRHFGSRYCPLSAGLEADIGSAHSPPQDRSNPKSSLSAATPWGRGGEGGGGSARLEFQLAAVSTLDSRRTCPSHAKSGHARGYPACRKPPRWHNLELVVQPVMILSCRNRSRHGANGTSHVWEEPAERSPPAIAPATFGSLLAPPVRTPGWG